MKKKIFNACLKTHAHYQTILSEAKNSLQNEKGATAVEYALVIGVVVLGIVGAASVMGGELTQFFKDVATAITDFLENKGQS